MSTLVIKQLPSDLHRRLREDAEQHHRSMTKHVIAILEANILPVAVRHYSPPVKLATPLTDAFLARAKQWGRA